MLRTFLRWLIGDQAPPTQPRRDDDAVTRDEFEARMKDFDQRTEWVLNEWHEKFSTLHARLSKRAQRAGSSHAPPPVSVPDVPEPLPSALNFRRSWSP